MYFLDLGNQGEGRTDLEEALLLRHLCEILINVLIFLILIVACGL